MTIKPLADKVLLAPMEAEETTASGLFIAASAQEKPEFMSVAAVGPGTEKYPMSAIRLLSPNTAAPTLR